MIVYYRACEPNVFYEGRQYDGTRASIEDLLQVDQQIPSGMQPGEWLVRQLTLARVRTYRDKTFRRTFSERVRG